MHRVRLSPHDFLRHLAGVQVVIDHELEVGLPTLIGTLAECLRHRPFSQREILGHLRDASENPAAPAALNHTAATTRTTVGQSLTLPPNPHETRMAPPATSRTLVAGHFAVLASSGHEARPPVADFAASCREILDRDVD